MNFADENLKMLVNRNCLRLYDILEILHKCIYLLKPRQKFDFDIDRLVDAYRDIETLNKYIYLSEYDFARNMFLLINVKGENVDEELKKVFEHKKNGDNDSSFKIPTYICPIIEKETFRPVIFDFSKTDNSQNTYSYCDPISYDFIVKMQSKIWNGILDTYISNRDINNFTADMPVFEFIFRKKYDADFINSIILEKNKDSSLISLLEKNISNLLISHKILKSKTDVNVDLLNSEKKYVISFIFELF